MGLNRDSMGIKTVDSGLTIKKRSPEDRVVALAGNPNVGKSTVFNELTGLNQHTGNWPGKTVANAQGYCTYHGRGYVFVDLPGCYSLMAHSAEEEAARDFICFEKPDAVIVVCDASCLERNLNLALQIMEVTPVTVLCVNLMDEAEKKKISLNLEELSKRLCVRVAGTAARSGRGLSGLLSGLEESLSNPPEKQCAVAYPPYIEEAADRLGPVVRAACGEENRWLCLRLLDGDESLMKAVERYIVFTEESREGLEDTLADIKKELRENGIPEKQISSDMVSSFVRRAERICRGIAVCKGRQYGKKDRRLDRLFTSRLTGFPIMFLLLLLIFWLTIAGANYPSALLQKGLFRLGDYLEHFLMWLHAPALIRDLLVEGIYRVLAWVVSVMLPPMAIFFPLFTLLEDSGYLPRVAFNLDACFKKCRACGKQALTM